MNTTANAMIEDLYHIPENGKAEIVDGALVLRTSVLPSPAVTVLIVTVSDNDSQQADHARDFMFAYKEILTLDDPKTLVLAKPLPLRKGQKVEIVILAVDEDEELEQLRANLAARSVTEADVREAIDWARENP